MKNAAGNRLSSPGSFGFMVTLAAILWTAVLAVSFAYQYKNSERTILSIARSTARESLEKDLIYRRWAAGHGGVYVPVTPKTPPNPYLAGVGAERDITTPSGQKLTLVNPAYMTRQVHGLMQQYSGSRGHITSLKPLNQVNAPNAYEQRVLEQFSRNPVEHGEVVTIGDKRYYRLMKPLFVDKTCLRCHATQGYKLGDLRGAIVTDIPMAPYAAVTKEEAKTDFRQLVPIWISGMAAIFIFSGFIRRKTSERQEAIESLARNEERFRTIVSTSLEGILTLNEQGNIDFLNARMAAMLGYREEEMLGRPLVDFLDEDEIEDCRLRLVNRHNGVAEKFERRFRSRDGSQICTLASAAPLVSSRGDLIGTCCMYVDISENKLTEKALRASEQRYRSLFNSMEEGFALHEIICDGSGNPVDYRFIDINPAFSTLTGLQRDAVMGRRVREILPGTEERWIESYGRVALSGEPAVLEEYSAALGRWYHVIVFRPAANQFAVLFTDITDRRLTEAALTASERRFRELLENISLVAVIIDNGGKVSFCNDYFLKLTGWSHDEVIGNDWFSRFIPNESLETVISVFNESIATGAVKSQIENPIVTSDGKRLTIVWDNTLLHHSDGTIAGIASIGSDITEKKLLEEQLRQSQKMEAIGQLAGGVAHDFNNLMQVITTYGYLIQTLLKENGLPQQFIDEQLTAARRAVELTGALLAFSRKQPLHPRACELNRIVQEAKKLLRRIIGEDIRIAVTTCPAELHVMADEGQLQQVLMNLATNARDAMASGGELTISTALVETDDAFLNRHKCKKESLFAMLSVADCGEGIGAEDLHTIFEPFFTTKEAGKGTGLGLAIIYGIVKQHNGFIEVDSVKGKGTNFRIYLPLLQSQPAELKTVSIPIPCGKETILLVEDDELVRNSLQTIIKAHGYKVIEATEGNEALALFREHSSSIDLVITDVIMPGLNGLETMEAIRKIVPEIRTIFISGYATDALQQRIMENARESLVRKPVDPDKLMRTIRSVLDNCSPVAVG